ncbi:segregation/condensation protein A [Thalassotalea sp. M1531]|uniref:Segregation and condensation protein A n=1 Tax=Thalassotalea algicola TaxID=2716224 RepID=A0A7Y0LGX0_9GAMM|nr:segregation/condensation protein A [Thalassotalea algicola]NMP33481.1 segregation/condensation protein A [Thalassotalea algicola]
MEQQDLPLAIVRGENYTEKPNDLYIPEDALEIHLDAFEGPLDLLLYLIKKQKFDIADLPIAPISIQYFRYIEQLEQQDIDLSSDYLVMAATLAHIKSRLLLPKPAIEEDEEDPRAELVRRLQEYQRIKHASEVMESLPREERDFFVSAVINEHVEPRAFEEVSLNELVVAFQKILKKQAAFEHHHIQREAIATHDKIEYLLLILTNENKPMPLNELFNVEEGRQGAVVTFLAVLELLKLQKINCLEYNGILEVSLI